MIDLRKPHKHAEVIKAWADGAVIEWYSEMLDKWCPARPEVAPSWRVDTEYRLKPRAAREFWINLYPGRRDSAAHLTPSEADAAAHYDRTECIKVREVIE